MSDAATSAPTAAEPRDAAKATRPAPQPGLAERFDRLFERLDALPLEIALVVFLRISAVIWLFTGLVHWARIVGYLPWRGQVFADMPIEWQSAIVFYGVIDLVAAVGLWLATSWGVTVWLIAIACQVLTHSALAEIFGERPFRVPFYLASVAVYLVLWWRVRRIAHRRALEEGF